MGRVCGAALYQRHLWPKVNGLPEWRAPILVCVAQFHQSTVEARYKMYPSRGSRATRWTTML